MIVYLGVGSNLGNRRANIKKAIQKINLLPKTKLLKQSRIIQTEPIGGPLGQPKFLNAALKISTAFSPLVLLMRLKKIEKEIGRVKALPNWPRKIDLDILLYGDKTMRTKRLVIPHPRMFKRSFVIKPLSEVI